MLITEYRLEIVIQALRAILPLEHPADTTLRYFFKNERIGSNERELVADTVFGVLRHRMLLEHACAENATPRRMALAHLLRFGGYNLRELEPVLKRDEKEWLATVKGVKVEDLPFSVQAELPEWLVEKMRVAYSDSDILMIGKSMQHGAPLDIRVNTLLAKREEVLQQLHEKNIAASATPYSSIGIRLKKTVLIHSRQQRTAVLKLAQAIKPHRIKPLEDVALFAVLRRAAMLIVEFENVLKARDDPLLLRRIGACSHLLDTNAEFCEQFVV